MLMADMIIFGCKGIVANQYFISQLGGQKKYPKTILYMAQVLIKPNLSIGRGRKKRNWGRS